MERKITSTQRLEGSFFRSRNDAPSRKRCVVNGQMIKRQAANNEYPPPGCPMGLLVADMLFHEKTAVSTETRDVHSRAAIASDARQIPVKGNYYNTTQNNNALFTTWYQVGVYVFLCFLLSSLAWLLLCLSYPVRWDSSFAFLDSFCCDYFVLIVCFDMIRI